VEESPVKENEAPVRSMTNLPGCGIITVNLDEWMGKHKPGHQRCLLERVGMCKSLHREVDTEGLGRFTRAQQRR